MNFCKYSRLYLDLQFSACIVASSLENSDLAEFNPFASIINLPSEIIKEEHEEGEECENEIELISNNFPRKRIGCYRCPVNLRKLPDPSKLPDLTIRINEMDMDIPNNRI